VEANNTKVEGDDSEYAKYDLSNDLKFKEAFFAENGMHAVANSSNNRPEVTFPQLFVNYCTKAKLYFIAPYYSASVVGCMDSEIIIGTVFGAIIGNLLNS